MTLRFQGSAALVVIPGPSKVGGGDIGGNRSQATADGHPFDRIEEGFTVMLFARQFDVDHLDLRHLVKFDLTFGVDVEVIATARIFKAPWLGRSRPCHSWDA